MELDTVIQLVPETGKLWVSNCNLQISDTYHSIKTRYNGRSLMGRSYNLWIKKMSIREPFFTLRLCESRHSLEGVNGVNRLATKGKKYHRLPTKREKNYRLPTGKLLTDYRHGPTLLIFFLERRVYCIFPTSLGINPGYHVSTTKRGYWNRFAERMPKISTTRLVLNIICDKCLN